MIRLTNISKLYLGKPLLDNISWHMKPGEKVGLIGANGTGKTTQLRIICNQTDPSSGEVYIAPNTSIGYLSQEPIVNIENTLDQELRSVFKEVLDAESQIVSLQKEIAELKSGSLLDEKLNEITRLQEFFDHKEGFGIDARIGQVISGLRFSEEDRKKLIKTFSGGWQMRISIAKLLLESPDLLLLDEPTNHLDIKAIEWLESYLSNYRGGYIIVSHDREFLEKTVTRIIEMDGSKVNLYWGNYTKYEKEKELRYETQLATYNAQQKKIIKEKTFIDKFRASAARSSQAKSRERQLEKMELVSPPVKSKIVNFKFPISINCGDDVLKILNLSKAFGDKVILDDINLEIKNKEKIAIIGDNGSGKTTFLRMIMDLDADYKGKIKPSLLLKPMYYNQHEARSLKGSKTAFEEVHDSSPICTNEQIRTTLGILGIRGDNVFKHLDNLSGGEKARVALAKMLLAGANVLIFDEPTNHLDIPAKEALEQALEIFDGAVIVVSHDRKFLDNFVTKIFEIEDKSINIYNGNYSYYKYKKALEKQNSPKIACNEKPEKNEKPKVKEVNTTRKLTPRSIEKEASKIEKDIVVVENTILELEEKLADSEFYQNSPEEFLEVSKKLDAEKQKLNQLNENYYELLELQESLN